MSKVYSLRFIASLIWIGFLLAISFMEAPLKFQAPSVTLPIGLEVGRIVFGTLNKVEWILLMMILLSLVLKSSTRSTNLILASITFILIFQTFYLLPELDKRAAMIISGRYPDPGNTHFFYVVLEVVKLILLSTSTYGFIFKQQFK